jgi:uncharacterized repeat protein (TIGR01451 family)
MSSAFFARARARFTVGVAAGLAVASVTLLVPGVSMGGVVGTSPAAAFTAPAAVKDISAQSVTSGVLFGGRQEAFAVNPVNSQIVFAAAEFGGLWKSGDGGGTWSHVDGVPLIAMDDVKFATSDPSLVVATGEYDGASTKKNAEVYVSADGGNIWTRANTTTCGGNPRSAHKIGIGTGTPGALTIFVATDCGLIKSSDSGGSWSNVSPNGINNQFWDMRVLGTGPNFTIDTCGGSGFFRSTDGGGTWAQNAGALAGGSTPCRVAEAPGNSNVVLLSSYASASSPVNGLCMGQLLESDNGGTSFTNLNATQDGNCRPADVITAPGFSGAASNFFEVFFATDTNWIHEQCDLNNLPGSTACPIGNGNNGGSFSDYDSSIKAVHNGPDSSDLAFGPDGCPFLAAGDGGVFKTSDGCDTSPTFTQANVGLEALQATATGGTSYSGHTDLYMPTQDNGIWNTGNGGGSWAEQGPDVYGVLADQDGGPSQVLYKTCCVSGGGTVTSSVSQDNESLTGAGGFNLPPTGVIPLAGPFLNVLAAQFGYQKYAMVTCTSYTQFSTGTCGGTAKVFVTTNNGGSWTQMGPDLPANSNPLQLLESGPSGSPSFYLLSQVGANPPTVSRLAGPLNSSATLTPTSNGLSSPSRIGVDPTNPLLLYAEDDGLVPTMMRSVNGGATWTADNSLTNLIENGAQFSLPGFVTAIGFDGSSSTVLVGTAHNGIFASTNGGNTWSQLRGSIAPQSPTGFFFDEKTGKAYTASKGRAVWEIDLPHADLSVTKTHFPDPATAGTQLTWELTVSNAGPDAAPDVTVTDTLPNQVDYLTNNLNPPAGCSAFGQTVTCNVGDLDKGQSVTFDIVTFVHPDAVVGSGGATSITNSATVTSAAVVDTNQSNNTDEDTAIITDSADLSATKLCKPDTTIYAGTPINCTVFVDNHGPSFARNVVLDDTTLSSGAFTISNVASSAGSCNAPVAVTGGQKLTCSLGNLANASTTSTGRDTVTYTITANDGQDINNVASVRSDTPDPDPTNNQATVNLTVTSLADLALTKNGPASVVAGTPISWTLTVHNLGPSTASNVAITDTVPAGVTITAVSMPGGSCVSGAAGDPTNPTVCTIGSLAAAATSTTMTVTATVNPQTTGVLENDARVSSGTFDNNSANDLAHTFTTLTVQSDVSVAIAATPNPVTAGTPLSYQITVSNSGPSTATGVSVSDALPAGVTFGSTSGAACGYQTNINVVSCTLPNLDPGQSAVVFIYTTVKPSTLPPSISDSATASSTSPDPNAANNTVTITTTVQTSADLAIVLTSDANVYKPSSTIHYQITVNNFGPSDAQHVVIVQNLPTVKQGKYISNNLGCAPPVGTTLTCQFPTVPALGTVPAGGSLTFQVNFFITGNKQTITSSATVSSATPDPVATNNLSTRNVTVK